MPKINLRLNLNLYKKMYLIKRAEEKIREHYSEDEMKTPMHMSLGGEAISAGVCGALQKKDQVFGTYRSHALYLAKTGDTNKFFAEMYGRSTGGAKGKAGSMHLSYPEKGMMQSSAVVASNIPVAVGAAFANKKKKKGIMTAVFFGDGATEEGNFWESLNAACLMKLPVLLVCEDNGLSMHTPKEKRQGFRSITAIVSKFNCNVFEASTPDAEKIYQLAKRAVGAAKRTHKPSFLRLKYYRYLEHVGVNEDFEAGYRPRKEFERWLNKDPLTLQRKKLLDSGVAESFLQRIEKAIGRQIEKSLTSAYNASFAEREETYKDVYA